MKIHYRNFTRVGSNFDDPTIVPDRLKNRPRLLDLWEVAQFFSSLAVAAYATITAKTWLDWLGVPVAIMLFVSAYLLAMENHWYRKASSLAVLAGVVWLLGPSVYQGYPTVSLFASLTLSFFAIGMYTTKKSRSYYAWCKSNSKGA